jgi:radical SAM superfamily enzyme YgiQ (UPF0313 family)
MKVLWLVPPAHKGKYPNIGQYRFYKNTPVKASYEYPYLNAMGVTQVHEAGYDVMFRDCPAMSLKWDDVDRDLDSSDLIIMEARTPIVKYIYEIAENLRDSTRKVALYGDHVSVYPEEALEHCDYVIAGGDYDFGAACLARALEAAEKDNRVAVPRIFKAGLVQNLDSLPHVNRDLVPNENYFEAWKIREHYLYTMSGRGCPFDCTFCAWNRVYWENRVRQRSVKDVVSEFWEAYAKYGECYIWDDHDCFPVIGWGERFAQALLDSGNKNEEILWAFQTHSNMIRNLDTLKLMKKAGLHLVKLGIESGNQESLNLMHKSATVEQHEEAIRLLKEADVTVHANLVVGWPWETKKEAYHTIDWIKKLDPNQAQFSLLIPYPWTELFDWAKSHDKLLVAEGDWESYDATHPMMKMEDMTNEEVVQLYHDCWSKFYLNWRYMLKHLSTVHTWADIKQLVRGYYSVRFGHMRSMKKS